MYLIHFKKKINPIEVDRTTGDALKDMRERKSPKDTLIDLNGLQIELGDIGIIEPIAKPRSSNREEYIPLTPEQRAEAHRLAVKMGDELRAKGIIGKSKPAPVRDDIEWHTHCIVCGKELPKNLARVCSGECYVADKNNI